MKVLKIILSIMGTFFFFCMVAIPMMYSCGTIKNIRLSALSITLFALLTLICILGRKILTRHEDNPEWLDYLEDIAQEGKR